MSDAAIQGDHRTLVETARAEIQRRLNATVIKGVAQVRRRSIVAGFELAPRGNRTNPIRIAVKLARTDRQVAEFDQPADRAEDAVTREFAALAAASRLHADSLPAVGVPQPKFILDRPLGFVMSFVTGHALRDILTGGYAAGIPMLADRADEKAAGLVALLTGLGDAAVGTAQRDSSAEIASAERILKWLAHPARRREFTGNPADMAARLAAVAKDYRPAPARLCHGDLKCCNLMLDQTGTVFIVDFEDVVHGDPNLDIADILLSLRIDSSLYPPAVETADLMATELVRAWKRRHAIDVQTLAFPMFLQAAYHAGRQLDAALREPGGSDRGHQRVAACVPWLTGQRETLTWLERIFTAAENVTH